MTVSIAIALYNGERFVEQQLDSLRTQTVVPDQVIMCDDGSKDNTVDVVKNYIEKHSLQDKWKIYSNEKNLGYAKNFYHAMELCDGDLIYLCDQDDIWKNQKIEKMNKVMAQNPKISLLMCKGGVIDQNGDSLHGVMIKESKDTENLTQITSKEILKALQWTGMLMCVRKTFFQEIKECVSLISSPHDFILALCAADKGEFFVYDYIGAFHRRHNNNTANEEHNVMKTLETNRKLRDINDYNNYLLGAIEGNLSIKDETLALLKLRYEQSKQRETALKTRSLKLILKIYFSDKKRLLRFSSFLSDVWIVLFGGQVK